MTTLIISPNPMPSTVDWDLVQSTLDVTIVQGHPSDTASYLVHDDHSPSLGLRHRARRDFDTVTYEDARTRTVWDVKPSTRAAIEYLLDAAHEGRKAIVIADPVLVRAVSDLVHADSSHSSLISHSEGTPVDPDSSEDSGSTGTGAIA